MAKRRKKPAEFRFYELAEDEPVLALLGTKWKQVYGTDVDNQHFHNLLEIGCCHYGTGDLVIEDDSYRFGENMVSCIPANFLHVTKSDDDVEAYWEYLYINPSDILKASNRTQQEINEVLEAVNQKAFFVNGEENPILFTLVSAIIEEMRRNEEYQRECVRGMVYALLYEIAQYNSGKGSGISERNGTLMLENAIDYVEKNYAANFKVSELARVCHMSETHFRRIFQEKMNMTPVEYVNFVRVKKACELIDKTDISMEDVAEKVGFITPSTFNRNFKRIIGTSPYQWKKRPDNHERKLLDYQISALKGW